MRRAIGQVFARPEFQWVERQRVVSWLARQWHNLIEWLNRLSAQHPIGFDIGVALVVVALIAVLVHIGYVMWRIVRPSARTGQVKPAAAPGVIADAAAHLAYAEALARAGRYAEALGHRFLALVLELDRRKALRFHASKTPAEYVGEARLTERGRASLADLVARLYRHLFGAVPCDAGAYEMFGDAAQELARGPYVVPA
ncbi:MAG TPA: DUF4129 domain-containing protein [Gemmatimonadales bacterium]